MLILEALNNNGYSQSISSIVRPAVSVVAAGLVSSLAFSSAFPFIRSMNFPIFFIVNYQTRPSSSDGGAGSFTISC